MQNQTTISVIGGDTRNIYLAGRLISAGYDVKIFGFSLTEKAIGLPVAKNFEDATTSDVLILPLPYSKNGKTLFSSFSENEITVKKLLEQLKEGQRVFYGMGTPAFRREVAGKGAVPCDYYDSEALKLKNALLTAEGIVGIIIEKMNVTINGMSVAITGYGRVGHYTAALLHSMGARVTVFARDGVALTKARLASLKAAELSELKTTVGKFDCIINTVPSPVFNDAILDAIRPDTLLIETASAPYGIDFEKCTLRRLNLVKAFSLPGKTAPRTAGVIIAQTIEDILKKEANLI